jgi:hypothetical protein
LFVHELPIDQQRPNRQPTFQRAASPHPRRLVGGIRHRQRFIKTMSGQLAEFPDRRLPIVISRGWHVG